jgi:adenylate kinase
MRLIILGPPGVGKGTQAKILSEKFSIPHLSSGDILRSEIDAQSDLGKLAQSYMNEGKLVPDNVVLDMMVKRLQQEDVMRGFILDGFPRTIAQAEGLGQILEDLNQELDAAIAIEGDTETIVQRLSNRRSCRNCGAITNLLFNHPKEEGKCNRCGGEFYQRDDDKPEVIRERLEVYHRQTEPLIDYYKKLFLLKRVNGMGTIGEVTNNILTELE